MACQKRQTAKIEAHCPKPTLADLEPALAVDERKDRQAIRYGAKRRIEVGEEVGRQLFPKEEEER